VLSFKDLCGTLDIDTTLLILAVKQANVDAIDGLRARGVDPNVKASLRYNGLIVRTALNVAVALGRMEVVQALLRFKDIDHRGPGWGKCWPLTMAMRPFVDPAVARLVAGLYTESPQNNSWIRAALKAGVPERIDWVLDRIGLQAPCHREGPDPSPWNTCERALKVYVEFRKAVRHVASVKWLLIYAAATRQPLDIDCCFCMALQAAAVDTIEYLLDLGASTTKLYEGDGGGSDNRDYVLQVAVSGIASERRRQQKMNKEILDPYSGTWHKNAMVCTVEEFNRRAVRIIELLLRHGADPNATHTKRYACYSPLAAAIKKGEVTVARTLLRWRSADTPLLRLDILCGEHCDRARKHTVRSILEIAYRGSWFTESVISDSAYSTLLAELDAYPCSL
jgi:hypothetical protein